MIIETVSEESVLTALSLASRAPSVHNSQPWLWRLGPGFVHLYSDPRRWLPATDPDARDLMLSCGTVLHHLTVALAATEIQTVVHRLPNRAEPDASAPGVRDPPAGPGLSVRCRPSPNGRPRASRSGRCAPTGCARH